MTRKRAISAKPVGADGTSAPAYGDLTQLNRSRLILDSVGRETLTEVVRDFLDLLGTSAAVYERNGDYALGIFSSGWCRFLDRASRRLCNTPDDRAALESGRWLCHESCWRDAANRCMEAARPMDVECHGGLRLYAMPIRAGGEVVGAINFGYGDPPTDPGKLGAIARKYQVSPEELRAKAEAHETRPGALVDQAKARLATSARLIGEIVERRQAEDKLRFLSAIAEQIRDAVLTTDMDFLITYTNRSFHRLYGYSQKELLGRSPAILNAECDAEQVQRDMYQAVSSGGVWTGEVRNRRKDGSTFICELHVFPLVDERGTAFAYAGIQRDVTERKRTEEALRESEQRFRDLTESASDWVWEVDASGRYTYCSPKVKDLLGYEVQEVLGKLPFDLMPAEEADRVGAIFQVAAARRTPLLGLENVNLHRDGHRVVLETSGVPFFSGEGDLRGYRGIDRDVTERKRAEQAMRLIQFAVDHVADSAFWMGPDARFTYVNDAACRSLGYSRDELLGMSVYDIDPDLPAARWPAHWKELRERGSFTIQSRHRAKDGRVFPVEIALNHVAFEGREYNCAFARDITERRQAAEEIRNLARFPSEDPDPVIRARNDGTVIFSNPASRSLLPIEAGREGSSLPGPLAEAVSSVSASGRSEDVEFPHGDRVFAVRLVPVAEGGYVNLYGRDVTAGKRAEEDRRKLEAQLQHAQKLESLGVLAGGIAHDFNNLLVAVLGNAELALSELPEASPVRETVKEIKAAAIRASELTNQMLAYSGKGAFVVQALDLNELVTDMSNLLRVSVSKKIKLKRDLRKGLPAIEADASQIGQVLMNLITNASEAIGEASGGITIRTGVAAVGPEEAKDAYLNSLAAGRYVYLEVSDTGCGMDEQTRGKVFDPFFTTKFTGRGLGLAAVLGIVQGHHGAMKIDSEVGEGTTFTILFPALDESRRTSTAPEGPVPIADWRGAGTILLVDDEPSVRKVATAMLERLGFTVLAAEDGRKGVELFRQHADEIALVLLDMTMPGLSGEQAFHQMRSIRPSVAVVLCSGYSEQDAMGRFKGEGPTHFLQKPFALDHLVAQLRAVLAPQAPGQTPGAA